MKGNLEAMGRYPVRINMILPISNERIDPGLGGIMLLIAYSPQNTKHIRSLIACPVRTVMVLYQSSSQYIYSVELSTTTYRTPVCSL